MVTYLGTTRKKRYSTEQQVNKWPCTEIHVNLSGLLMYYLGSYLVYKTQLMENNREQTDKRTMKAMKTTGLWGSFYL